MGLKGSDKKQKKFLIDFRWEVHKFDNPEGFKPKQFLHTIFTTKIASLLYAPC